MLSKVRNLCILLSLIWSVGFVTANADLPTVQIKNGTLAGLIMRSRKGREFVGFRGIPYALPPLGELRFEPPKPANSWAGVRLAQEDANICTQRNIFTHDDDIVGVEDCLYLNVYTPKLPLTEEDKSRGGFPVMIWFHGGGWVTGAGHSDFYGPKFLLDHDVVLVTINFRLGPLGFLSTEDMTCPGNQGMKDQVQSIRWVRENIAAFGGDPNRITLFGESAGGASVNHHMISRLSNELFHRAISQSGTTYCPWTLNRPGTAKQNAKRLGDLLNCSSENSAELIKCLRQRDAVDIIATDRDFQIFDYCPLIPFRPVIEPDHPGAFLTEDPALAMKLGRVSDIPWMTGITSEEGAIKVPILIAKEELVKRLNDEFMNIAPMTFLYEETCSKAVQDEISKKIRQFYFGDRAIGNSTRSELINLYSDAWFTHGAQNSVRDYMETQSSPVYYYYFTYKGSASFSKLFGDPTQDYGVSHADDLQYLFPVGEQLFKETTLSKDDHKMIDLLTSLWVNFASTGNPTPKLTETVPTKWKPVRTHALEYLYIGNEKVYMSENLLLERTAFWNSLPIRPDLEGQNIKQSPKDEL